MKSEIRNPKFETLRRIVFIVGPTGVGKSELAFLLAQKYNAEIVSCDSMQIYREVNIACDKPPLSQRAIVPHHLLDVASVTEEFDVARFRSLAVSAIEAITLRGKMALVVGGSGLYMSILLDGIFDLDIEDAKLREELRQKAQVQGPAVLHQQLVDLDPRAAAKIQANDTRRLIRALEVTMLSGQPISALQSQRSGLWNQRETYSIDLFALNRPREDLYQGVERRIDHMFEKGLVEEVSGLIKMPLSRTASGLIGIGEVKGHLNKEYDLARAKYLLKRNTRHYVKRQLTWFRRDQRIQWLDIREGQSVGAMAQGLANTGKLA